MQIDRSGFYQREWRVTICLLRNGDSLGGRWVQEELWGVQWEALTP